FMSYYNIVFRYGIQRFAAAMKDIGLAGAIIPDLPPEEAHDYTAAMDEHGLAPIFLFAPTTPPERMVRIAERARGFIYCVARKGVTGLDTAFSEEVAAYLGRARAATTLPLAVGFGIKGKSDVDYLKGKAEIAVVGSQMLRVVEEKGPAGAGPFCASLR
ncbi:MAG TPA: tryptophan synthase subunit alpha, partial [Spirochaetia bacterium]|nr:tryptophan synthase subunit alpha [Spirochaetia bacterium]